MCLIRTHRYTIYISGTMVEQKASKYYAAEEEQQMKKVRIS
jgi:hypothetical protein